MRCLVNIVLTIGALVLITPIFVWCLMIAIIKWIRGKEPILYERYVNP